ncbi:MAG: biotin/lipoyl-binding protein [Rhodobacteraceae bacterium]|nr:biotin/lipoyl-binding protein [Paracoccaceae bacterium]
MIKVNPVPGFLVQSCAIGFDGLNAPKGGRKLLGNRLSIVAAIVLVAGAAYYFLASPGEDLLPEGIVVGNGRVEAVQVDVSTKIPGRVSEVVVREGDLVNIGDVVARMDVAQLEAQLMRARRRRERQKPGRCGAGTGDNGALPA